MIPKGWSGGPLHTILESIDAGWSPQCETRPAAMNEWGVLKVSAVTSGTYISQENKALPALLSPRPELEVRGGDVLLARANGVLELVGRTAFVRETRPRLMLSDKILRLRPARGVVLPEFLHMVLSFAPVRDALMTVTGGSHMRNVSQASLRELLLTYPPLPEQRKIAAILTSVDEAIEGTQAVIDQLGVVRKAMMAALLTRGIPGRHTKFKQTEIGEVPESWGVKRVEDAGQVDCGKARDPRAMGIPRPYLRVANVFDGEIRTHDVLEMPFTDSEFERFSLKFGDVLLNEGQSIQLVGRCSLYRDEVEKPCAIQNALLRFRLTGLVTGDFAEQYFRWCQYSGLFAEIATQTTSIAHLGLKRFGAMKMPVPPLSEQAEINQLLTLVDSRLRSEMEFQRALVDTKTALMSVLLTGEVRVQPDEDAA